MNTIFNVGNTVILKAEPNAGEMVVSDITEKYYNISNSSADNPVYHCKYWNDKEQKFIIGHFLGHEIELVRKS
ncbi:MAG: hypothetical protein WD334_10960 [Chitinophagales bacterium]